MPTLEALQKAFIAAVVNGDGHGLRSDIHGDPGQQDRRLAVHRNNWRANLRGALRVSYPVVERLVGGEFFDYMAERFIDASPSDSANLEDYGAGFAAFIAGFAPARSLPYLADVARLEALADAVLTAPDHAPAAAVAGMLTVTLADTAALLESPFPVHRIWEVNQPEWQGEQSVDLGEGAVQLLIHRRGIDLVVSPVGSETFALLQHLQRDSAVLGAEEVTEVIEQLLRDGVLAAAPCADGG